jgi:hypothetical protein
MLAQLLTHYPTGSLISELLQIHEGKFVVQVSVIVDGVTRATGLAAAENLELAEDRARSRALMVVLPETSSGVQPEGKGLEHEGVDLNQPEPFATTNGRNNSRGDSFSSVPSEEPSSPTPAAPLPVVEDNDATNALTTGVAITEDKRVTFSSADSVIIPFGDEEPADSYDYSYEENIPSPEPEPEPAIEVNEPFDLSDAIAQTSTELKRLGWNNQKGRRYLEQTYGKRSRHELDDEMLSFLAYLESQPTPAQ